ncbi:MAG: PLP-dependent aminotransferase family protein [Nocardioidaceae bacterium]|nr:PLP-dependent aminotransferase family protein [Nocardioidaceae bacterium]
MDRRHSSAPSAEQLARMLGGWVENAGRLPERLARALRLLVQLGELLPGTRLPSERTLATALVISRSTVVMAYDLLRGEGLLDTKSGSGHRIANDVAARSTGMTIPAPFPWQHRLTSPESAVGYPRTVVDLSAIAISASPVLLEVLATLTAEDWASAMAEPGYLPLGWPPLRRAVADECSRRGLPTTSEQVMITSGAQQGMSLVAGALIQPGDVVVVEDPLYPGQLPVLREAGARLRTVPVDSRGLDIEALARTVDLERPRLVFVSPTHHNPTGSLLGADGRARIAALAGATSAVVVELYASADLPLNDHPVPAPLAAVGNSDSMVVIGSLSPLVWSGLRIGWLRAPEHLIASLGQAKAVADLGTSLLSQFVATRVMERLPTLNRHRNNELASRCEQAMDLLGELLPDFEVTRPDGGACLWVRIPAGDAGQFAHFALRDGVAVLPGHLCSARGAHQDRLRLSFACDPTRLHVGIERLAFAWADYRRHTH